MSALLFGLQALPATAQHYQTLPERRTVAEKDWAQWLGPFRARVVPTLMEDFGERNFYASANAALPAPRPGERRVVFLGGSITDRWNLAAGFPARSYVDSEICSQVTARMILRFHQDMVALKVSAVVVLAGIADLRGFPSARNARTDRGEPGDDGRPCFCKRRGYAFADYYTPFIDDEG